MYKEIQNNYHMCLTVVFLLLLSLESIIAAVSEMNYDKFSYSLLFVFVCRFHDCSSMVTILAAS